MTYIGKTIDSIQYFNYLLRKTRNVYVKCAPFPIKISPTRIILIGVDQHKTSND